MLWEIRPSLVFVGITRFYTTASLSDVSMKDCGTSMKWCVIAALISSGSVESLTSRIHFSLLHVILLSSDYSLLFPCMCVCQCQVDSEVTEGQGQNKRLARRKAAEAMIELLGFSPPSSKPSKPAIKSPASATVL